MIEYWAESREVWRGNPKYPQYDSVLAQCETVEQATEVARLITWYSTKFQKAQLELDELAYRSTLIR